MATPIDAAIDELKNLFDDMNQFVIAIQAAVADPQNVLYIAYPSSAINGTKVYEWFVIKLANAQITTTYSRQNYMIEITMTGAGVHGFSTGENYFDASTLIPGRPTNNSNVGPYFIEAGKIDLAADMQNGFDRNGKLTFTDAIGLKTTKFSDDALVAQIVSVADVKEFIDYLPVINIINQNL